MDKIRLLTNGGYGNEVCKAGDILEVVEWIGPACDAYVPSQQAHLHFFESEFEKVVEVEQLEIKGLFVVLCRQDENDELIIEGPYSYQEAVDEKFLCDRSQWVYSKIAKLSFLD